MSAQRFGLLLATDRHGAAAGQREITGWPVTVGRDLEAGLVLDDSHIAAMHLSLDGPQADGVAVRVLDSVNGVTLDGARHARGAAFIWKPGQHLTVGRMRLGLRLAGQAIEAEELLPSFPWRAVAGTMLAFAGLLAMVVAYSWLTLTEPSQLARALPGALGAAVLIMAVWAGLWALATKLFTGRTHFWTHVRIASISALVVETGAALASLAAFMFSLESLARFESLLHLLGVAVAVYFHLKVIAPHRQRAMAGLVASVALAGMMLMLGTTWLQSKRLSNRLYLSSIFPPSWRMAPAVPVRQFVEEAGGLRKRLDQRLKDGDSDDAPDESDAE